MTTQYPPVAVIILNYNSWQATVDYILLLKRQKAILLSILVVDNCSPDGSFSNLHQHYKDDNKVEVIQSDYNGGYAYGNNFGLKHLETSSDNDTLVLISNNDISIDNEMLLKQLIDCYSECKDIAFIAPLMHIEGKPAPNCAWKIPGVYYDISTVISFDIAKANQAVYYKLPPHQKLMEVDCLSGAFFMGKLATFSQLDYFDERTFLYEEERILGQKVKNMGLKNYLSLKLRFFHEDSAVISKEMGHHTRIRHLLNSRLVFHKYYAGTNALLLTFLKLFYSFFLFAKTVQLRFKKNM